MKIAVVGAAGRMGQMLIRQIARTEGVSLAAASEAPGSKAIGKDAGEVAGLDANGIKIGGDSAAAIAAAQVVIDFTVPAATVAHAKIAQEKGVAMVIGTTGLDPQQTALIHEAAKKVPIMWAANMALGVNVLLALVEKTASLLDPGYDIEVRNAPPPQDRRAVRHGAGAGPCRRGRPQGQARGCLAQDP